MGLLKASIARARSLPEYRDEVLQSLQVRAHS